MLVRPGCFSVHPATETQKVPFYAAHRKRARKERTFGAAAGRGQHSPRNEKAQASLASSLLTLVELQILLKDELENPNLEVSGCR